MATQLKTYRRQIVIGYALAGVAASLLGVVASTSSMLEQISMPAALLFIAVMVIPMAIGGIVAKDVNSADDSWSPFAHGRAILEAAPVAIGGIAAVLILEGLLYQAELTRLLAVPPIVAGYAINWWMKQD